MGPPAGVRPGDTDSSLTARRCAALLGGPSDFLPGAEHMRAKLVHKCMTGVEGSLVIFLQNSDSLLPSATLTSAQQETLRVAWPVTSTSHSAQPLDRQMNGRRWACPLAARRSRARSRPTCRQKGLITWQEGRRTCSCWVPSPGIPHVGATVGGWRLVEALDEHPGRARSHKTLLGYPGPVSPLSVNGTA